MEQEARERMKRWAEWDEPASTLERSRTRIWDKADSFLGLSEEYNLFSAK